MRDVTLYTLNQTVMQAWDRVSFYRHAPLYPLTELHLQDVVLTSSVDRIDVPVHHVRSVVRDDYDRVLIKDHYIAIDPELEVILNAYIGSAYEGEVRAHENELALVRTSNTILLERIEEYNHLPWYKRIFKQV